MFLCSEPEFRVQMSEAAQDPSAADLIWRTPHTDSPLLTNRNVSAVARKVVFLAFLVTTLQHFDHVHIDYAWCTE